jgi:hypothetical protein
VTAPVILTGGAWCRLDRSRRLDSAYLYIYVGKLVPVSGGYITMLRREWYEAATVQRAWLCEGMMVEETMCRLVQDEWECSSREICSKQ